MQLIPHGPERFASERFASFRKNYVLRVTGTAAEIEADLAVLRSYAQRAKTRRLLLLVVALVILAVSGLAIANARGDDQGIIAAIGMIMLIVVLIVRMRIPTHFETRRVELASGLLRGIRVGAEPCSLTLDLAPIMARRKRSGKENGFDVYNDPFLELDVPLVDGTRIKVQRTEQLHFFELKTAKRHVREWKGTEWDTITFTASGGHSEYRERPPHDFSRLQAGALTLLPGFSGVTFNATASEVRVVLKNQLLWDAKPTGSLQPKRNDAVKTLLLYISQLGNAARLGAVVAHPPQDAWKAKLPAIGLRGGVLLMVVFTLMGAGLTIASGIEMPQHYEQAYEFHGGDLMAGSFGEDVIRTAAFGAGCCMLPFGLTIAMALVARKRRRTYEGA